MFNIHSKLQSQFDLKKDADDPKEEGKYEEDEDGNRLEPIKEEQHDVLDEDEEMWSCEFCYHKNIVNIEKEEIPTDEAVNYILEVDEAKKNKSSSDVSNIFCLDVSGSMCVTTAVEGKVNIKGDRVNEMQDLMKFSDGSDQFFKENKNITYISRLQ